MGGGSALILVCAHGGLELGENPPKPPLFWTIALAILVQFTSHVQEQAVSVPGGPGLHPEADRKKSPKIRTPKIGIRSSFVPLMDVASVFGASDPKCL